jgi:hypothetical protein
MEYQLNAEMKSTTSIPRQASRVLVVEDDKKIKVFIVYDMIELIS